MREGIRVDLDEKAATRSEKTSTLLIEYPILASSLTRINQMATAVETFWPRARPNHLHMTEPFFFAVLSCHHFFIPWTSNPNSNSFCSLLMNQPPPLLWASWSGDSELSSCTRVPKLAYLFKITSSPHLCMTTSLSKATVPGLGKKFLASTKTATVMPACRCDTLGSWTLTCRFGGNGVFGLWMSEDDTHEITQKMVHE